MNPRFHKQAAGVFARMGLAAATAVALSIVVGCSKEESKQAQRSPDSGGGGMSAPDNSSRQGVTLANLKLDKKVQFPEERAPSSQEAAVAIGAFASALASGNDQQMATLMGARDKALLDVMVQSGQWTEQARQIKTVRICSLTETDSGLQVGLGVQDALGAYLLGWEATPEGAGFVFSGMAIEPKFAEDVKQLDGASLSLAKLPEPKAAPAAKVAVDDKKPTEEAPPAERPASSDQGVPLKKDNF